MQTTYAEYLWLDGAKPTQQLRSKTRVLEYSENYTLTDFPQWGFDGSSTGQATGDNSDCELKPVSFIADPIRGTGNYLVMCEVFTADGEVHPTNTRAELRSLMEKSKDQDPFIGFEQEYTFMKGNTPLGWPRDGYPAPQGPFYCGVGAKNVFGREIVEDHLEACSEAGISIYGINAEVMPGQWEFQIGYRSIEGEAADPLTIADHTWYARYILHRIAEEYGVAVSFENKPVKGDWNGAGMHTNFSTKDMRDPSKGMITIESAIQKLGENHEKHIAAYGFGLNERLTGEHETCDINTFKFGVSDRGASIRIPMSTSQQGYGYFEDRRPGANSDPYQVGSRLLETCLDL